eukprot:gene19679-biopygen20543
MLWSRFPYSHKNDYSPFYSHENRGTTPSPAKRQRPRGCQVHTVPAGPTKLPPRTAPFVRGGPRCVQNWNGSKPPAAEDILLYSGAGGHSGNGTPICLLGFQQAPHLGKMPGKIRTMRRRRRRFAPKNDGIKKVAAPQAPIYATDPACARFFSHRTSTPSLL